MRHLRAYWYVLGAHRRKLLPRVALFIFVSVLDVTSVGLVGPYVAAVLQPERLERYPTAIAVLRRLADPLGVSPLAALGLSLALIFCTKGFIAFLIHRGIFGFAFSFRAQLIERLMQAYLSMPFSFYLSRGGTALVQSVTHHTKVLTDEMLIPSLRFMSDAFVLCLIAAFLTWVSPGAATTLAAVFGLSFITYIKLVRPRARRAGEVVSQAHKNIMAGVTQGIRGIKEIRVLGAERSFLEDVRRSARWNMGAETAFNSMMTIPRYLMETVVVLFILGLTLHALGSGRDPAEVFSVVAMFAAAGLRALPAMTQVSSSLASMNYSVFALHAVEDDLRMFEAALRAQPARAVHGTAPVAPGRFEVLEAQGLTYVYPGSPQPAINNLSLRIVRGSTVGFIGESGSGKTTLIDLLVGLHEPTSGRVSIDDIDLQQYGVESWMRRIAYIPQEPFVAEDTLARNVALGVAPEAIDEAKLIRCIEMARLTEVVQRLPDGMHTVLGGHGSRLSGGERQRVALARALYQERDVLVFDEATSALDAQTEREIVRTIEGLRGSKTILVIAHRLSTVEGCDIVHRLGGGRVLQSGSLAEVLGAGEAQVN